MNRCSALTVIVAVIGCILNTETAAACPLIDGIRDVNCDGRLTIVAFGDSITAGWATGPGQSYPARLKSMLPHAVVSNYGVSGEPSRAGEVRAKQLFRRLKHRVDWVIILEGINDYRIRKRTVRGSRAHLQSIKAYARKAGAVPLICKLPPMYAMNDLRRSQLAWHDALNRYMQSDFRISFDDLPWEGLTADGVHPNAGGYAFMVSATRTTGSAGSYEKLGGLGYF